MYDILLIEDNLELANLLKTLFLGKGFSLCHKSCGEEALLWLENNKPQLVLLDIMLSEMDGFAVCKKIRTEKSIPIFIISAKSTKNDQLLGFELGADDYIEKPIDFDILAAKIGAFLKKKENEVIETKTIRMEISSHKVYLKNELLDLNLKEYELLKLFLQNIGKTLYKSYLFGKIWGEDSFSEEQTLTVHIKMLRSKIEDDPKNPQKIITVWGVGYRYEEI